MSNKSTRKLLKKGSEPLTGFTIIEILITIAIFCLVVGLVFNIYVFSQRFYRQTETDSEILQNGRIILERISRDLHQASELVTQLPQTPDVPQNPPPPEVEFQDGHTPSPYQELGSNYYYVRYYLNTDTSEVYRQYRVYCFDPCATCSTYFRWNDIRVVDGQTVNTHSCDLEDKLTGEYVQGLQFWGAGLVNISLDLYKDGRTVNLKSAIYGRNF